MVSTKGFTFIEVMIVIAIIGILAAIAYPSYQQYVQRTNRTDVQSHLMTIAHNLERYKIANATYAGAALPALGASSYPIQGNSLYDIVLTDVNSNALSAANANVNTWLLVATPKATMLNNGVVCLNSRGEKFWGEGATACALSASSNWDGR